jgi:hypothetical protein
MGASLESVARAVTIACSSLRVVDIHAKRNDRLAKLFDAHWLVFNEPPDRS